MRSLLAGLAFMAVAGSLNEARAMTFTYYTVDGFKVLYADGDIVAGDAARLQNVLSQLPRDILGLKEMALNSNGGLVTEALRMGDVMDREGVYTYVADGGVCASACASVLFIDGHYHVVMPGGHLGFHTCYHGKTGQPAAECNELLAQNALDHGTPKDAIYEAIHGTSPNQAMWYNADTADCWGLTRWPAQANHQLQLPCVAPALQ
jgi:hypothetical protein